LSSRVSCVLAFDICKKPDPLPFVRNVCRGPSGIESLFRNFLKKMHGIFLIIV
jgi:hypothetical protein